LADPQREAGVRLILVLLLATCLASAAFVAFPDIDLATARFFYDGTTFPISSNRPVEGVRRALYAAEDLAFLVTLALTVRRKPFLNLTSCGWLFQMLIFLLGPGLIVNGLLKPIWGRARPFQVIEFGGLAQFTPAWVISDACCGYRSFVSGEMAGATALAIGLSLVLLANRESTGAFLYRSGIFLTFAVPLFTAWQRMAAGRHFLSDIVLAALLTLLLAATTGRILGTLSPRQVLLTSQVIPPISRLP
jgi:lipid A 4'-phosphatase